MADSDISVKVVADLSDIKDALKEIQKGTGTLKQVAGQDIDNVVGRLFVLKSGFDAVTQTIGLVKNALSSATIELAIMGEKAAQVENGFMQLASGAGIAGEELKQSIEKASAGTIETTTLLQRSSELIVAFGKDAERIPELIDLSRRVARSFGLETEDAFNKISESIRNGNTRALKQLGIYIDTEQAVKAFAREHGVAANAVTDVGRAQAILAAALDKGKEKFKGVSVEAKSVSESVASARVAMGDFLETVGLVISRTPGLTRSIELVGAAFRSAADGVKILFGSAAEQAQGQIGGLQNRLSLLTQELDLIAAGKQPFISRVIFGRSKEDVLRDIEETKAKLSSMKSVAAGEQFGPPSPAATGAAPEVESDAINKDKLKENARKFNAEIAALRLQNTEAVIKNTADLGMLAEAQMIREMELQDQLAIKKQEIMANDMLTQEQQYMMLEELEIQHQFKLAELRMLAEQERMNALQRQLEQTTAFDQQVALSAELQSMRTAQAWRRAGGLGGVAVQSFGNQAFKAFDAVGRGAMSAGDAMKSAFFGMLGEMASKQGMFMMLSSIWPPNPPAFAAGAALVALGGALSSMGGGGQGAGMGAGGGGAPIGGGGFGMGEGGPTVGDSLNQRRKEVTINIEGNYFESEQTKLAIVEAVRSSSDANDFVVQRGNRR